MNKRVVSAIMLGVVIGGFTSCKKDKGVAPYTVPASYAEFQNVEYSEAKASVNMWQGFQTYLGKSSSRQLSQDTVNKLWANTGNAFTTELITNLPFTPTQLNGFNFNLSAKTADAATIKALSDSMVIVSQYYNTPGGPGLSGKQGSRLFNYTGLEFNQAVAKGLMGAFALNKIVEHLEKVKSADNNTVVAGQGTAMQHEWDLAFGYVGIPADYDTSIAYAGTNPDRPLAIGGYFRERGKHIQSGGKVYEAFRKGRAAIAVKNYNDRDAAAGTIKEFVEKTIAAAFYYYVTTPQSGSDQPGKLHALSEGFGFMIALKHRPATSKLTEANYQKLAGIMNTNFYTLLGDATFAKLKEAQSILTTAYGQLQP